MKTQSKLRIGMMILLVVVFNLFGTNSYSQCDFSADFESGTLTDWNIVAGTNVISQDQVHGGSNALKMQLSGGYPKIESVQNNFGNGIYEAWFYITGSYAAAYFQFHYQDADNYYQLGMVPISAGNAKLILVKKVNGSVTSMIQTPPIFDNDEWFKMTLVRQANGNINVFINDLFQLAANDNSLSLPGKVAFMGYDVTTYLDDFCYQVSPEEPLLCDLYQNFENPPLADWSVLAGTADYSQDQALSGNYSLKLDLTGDYPAIISNQTDFSFGRYSAWFWVTGFYSAAFFKFNYIDNNNHYQLGMMPLHTDNPKLTLYKKENGNFTQLVNLTSACDIKSWFKMTVERFDNGDIKIYINDILYSVVNDTTFMSPSPIVFTGYDHTTYVDDFCYLKYYPVEINSLSSNEFNVNPNPVSDHLFLSHGDVLITDVKIIDMMGKTVTKHVNQSRVDVADLNQGIYILWFNDPDTDTSYQRKFVKH